MLGGLEPIIIFNFKVLIPNPLETLTTKIPVVSGITNAIPLIPIPVYLSEKITGLYIDSEEKNIDISTNVETLTDGGNPITNQKGILSSVKVNLVAAGDSIGLAIISALADLIFSKVTSKEYSISYFHGSITIFGGLLHTFQVSQNSENELYKISFEIARDTNVDKTAVPIVGKLAGATPITP